MGGLIYPQLYFKKEKHTMKKLLALLLVLVMLCGLAACVGDPDTTGGTQDPGTTAPTTGGNEIEDGPTTVVIYNPGDGKYVTGTEHQYNTKYELELTTDKSEALVLTVCENEDDTFTFATEDGKYLYADGTDVKLVDAEGDNTKFVLEEATGGCYIRCATAEYSGKAQYLELYSGYLTCYGMGSNTGLYTFVFYDSQSGEEVDLIESTTTPVEMPAFDTELTVAELLALPLASGEVAEGRYYVTATVTSVTSAEYGQMYISDGTGTISIYGTYSADGSTGYASLEEQPVKGDTVKLYVLAQNYNGEMEIKNAWIISFTKGQLDESAYTEMTIAAARETDIGTKVKVTGVVAQITYANGMKPSGVLLVDESSSIYVYDTDLANNVAVGNKITIAAAKTMWILDTETSNAAKYGYEGCNQLEDAYLLENDNGSNDYKSWVSETTVKQIMDTPVTEDITSVLYKVTALVTRKVETGFINYYIDDLDGETGSYVYTQCNGSDLEWMQEYDGKICTVYVTALNAKSSASGCVWRFLVTAVEDNGYTWNVDDTAEFVVNYYGVDQFDSYYTANPEKELITTVDSELLGFTGATLSYTSSNEEVISVANGKLECLKNGTAIITVTGEYNGKTYESSVTVTYMEAKEPENSISVKDAIAATVGETVTVKGIVGPSLVVQTGFYLISDEGMIAVRTDSATMATLSMGDVVVLTGERAVIKKDAAGSYFGQSCIDNATVDWNGFGSNTWNTDWYTTGLTVADFCDLDVTEDYTTTVYTLTVTVEVVKSAYYSNIYLKSGDSSISLYCSGAAQYSWLMEFDGQEITVDVAACNWNGKGYKGCVLSATTADGTVYYNQLNFSN